MWLLLLPLASAADDPRALSAEAVTSHPALAAADARADAADAEAGVARRWSDPELMLGLMNVPLADPALDREMMTGVELRLSQTLPSPGMPAASRDAALARLGAARAMGREQALALTVGVERAWWELARARQLKGLSDRQIARAGELLEAVRARYETGGAGQGELLELALMRDRMADEQGELSALEAALSAELAAAVGRPDLVVGTPPEVEALAPIGDAATWVAALDRPELAALEAEREEALAMAGMAAAAARPMVMVFASVMVRPGFDEMASLGVSAPLPVASAGRGRAEAEAERSRARAAGSDLGSARREIEAGLRAAEASWRRAWEKAVRYEQELLPAARDAVQTVRNDFALGKADFDALYRAETQLVDLERSLVEARTETRLMPLTVYRLTGVRPEESR